MINHYKNKFQEVSSNPKLTWKVINEILNQYDDVKVIKLDDKTSMSKMSHSILQIFLTISL